MTLFFDLKTLESQSGHDPFKFVALLEYYYTKKLPSKKSKYKPSKISLTGNSFILNPNLLFADTITDVLFRVQYIKLAAYRDYSLYKLFNYKCLDLSFFPEINQDAIKHNPLLTITLKQIKFKYEEI
jgi:hypothetical protein